MRWRVAWRPSSMRSNTSRSVPGRRTTVSPRWNGTPWTGASASPGLLSMSRGALAIVCGLQLAVEAEDVLGSEGQRSVEHLSHDRILRLRRAALGITERVDMKHERLLDLSVVEQ